MRISASIRRRTQPPFLGVVGGLVEWLFAFPQRLSVTISNARPAGGYAARGTGAGDLAGCLQGRGRGGELPPWQIVRERRATFEATPEQNACGRARRPPGKTFFLPATGLIRGCRRPSRDRCARATAPPIWYWRGVRPDRDHGAIRVTESGRELQGYLANAFRHHTVAVDPGALENSIASATRSAARLSADPMGTGCSSWKPTARFRPSTCCFAIISASPSMPSSKPRSPTICAASRARMAAGRWCTMARST